VSLPFTADSGRRLVLLKLGSSGSSSTLLSAPSLRLDCRVSPTPSPLQLLLVPQNCLLAHCLYVAISRSFPSYLPDDLAQGPNQQLLELERDPARACQALVAGQPLVAGKSIHESQRFWTSQKKVEAPRHLTVELVAITPESRAPLPAVVLSRPGKTGNGRLSCPPPLHCARPLSQRSLYSVEDVGPGPATPCWRHKLLQPTPQCRCHRMSRRSNSPSCQRNKRAGHCACNASLLGSLLL
jgi:hypothetical protein